MMEEPVHDYSRVKFTGKTVNKRTAIMLGAAQKTFGKTITLTQGSYNAGGVAASAGTHDGGGVVDISVNAYGAADRAKLVQALRKAGFFAWLRTPPAFVYHIHAVAIGDRELSSAARSQIAQGFADRNGLANHGPDPDPDPYPAWVDKYGRHVSLDRPKEAAAPKAAPAADSKLKLVTRAAWGGPPAPIGTAAPVRQGLAVHHDGDVPRGLAGKPHADCVAVVKGIHDYHVKTNGWAGIGYAWLCCQHGYAFEGRGFDRVQAAQPGGNSSHQSVQFMLGGDERPTPAMLDGWYALRDWLYGKGVAKNIRPHSWWVPTSCPGDYLRRLITDGTLAKEHCPPAAPAPAEKPWVWVTGHFKADAKSNSTLIVQKALAKEVGLDYSSGPGYFGPRTRAAYAQYQRSLGFSGTDADGTPGYFSLRTLGEKYGFDVRRP